MYNLKNVLSICQLIIIIFFCVTMLHRKTTNSVVNEEMWNNLLIMSNVPSAVRHWFVYSETESSKLADLEANDPALIDFIRKRKIVPEPPEKFRTRLPPKDYSRGNALQLMNIFQNKTRGIFVECGAYDGVTLSNTFFMERKFNWTGLLIEAEPNNFEMAIEKKRNAMLVPACLSISTRPQLMSFVVRTDWFGKLDTKGNEKDTVKVQCLPLYSILLATNTLSVDLFSLDIEGNELDVLMTIPFDKVDIKVFLIEFSRIHQGEQALMDFMASKDYVVYPSFEAERERRKWAHEDYIFIKKDSGYRTTRGDS